MQIHSYTGGHVFTNGYIIELGESCIVIDAPAGIHEVISQRNLKPSHLLLTHQHFDHTEDVEALQNLGSKVFMHSEYSETLVRQKEARENWGIPVDINPFTTHSTLSGVTKIDINRLEVMISHIPGHSPDSVTFYFPELEVVFSGDTLMKNSIGRTDLPGGSHQQLIDGIRNELYTLPPETVLCPGHGDCSNIGHEISNNPFI